MNRRCHEDTSVVAGRVVWKFVVIVCDHKIHSTEVSATEW